MVQTLPRLPRGEFKFKKIGNAIQHRPPFGGEVQVIDRLGARYSVEAMRTLRGEQGMAYVALLNANTAQKVRLPINQSMVIGNPGTTVTVSANLAGGTTLPLTGLTPSYAFKGGQVLTVVRSGKRYLHMVVLPVTASAGGAATLQIDPPLRVAMVTGTVVEVAQPSIEGFLRDPNVEWTSDFQNLVTFTVAVEEAE